MKVMVNDVSRAYFYAESRRAVFVDIPAEDWEEGDEERCAQLNYSMYGTRDAAANWYAKYSRLLMDIGFEIGKASSCHFWNPKLNIKMIVHGDDLISVGPKESLL